MKSQNSKLFLTYPAAQKKFLESIVLVPYYGGTVKTMQRHIELLNSFGFDVCVFDTATMDRAFVQKFGLAPNTKFGLIELWADQVEQVLNQVAGKKIVFSFSSPSFGAVKALVRRNCVDVKAWVCDGGPWYGGAFGSLWKYFTHAQPIKNPIVKGAVSGVAYFLWGISFQEEYRHDIKRLPAEFPVLSIRGWKDPMVPPQNIEAGFAGAEQLDLYVLGLPEGGHLNGLRDFSREYVPKLEEFLNRFGTPSHRTS